MPVKEASFWVFLAMFSTGLYFIFERLDHLRMFGAIVLLVVGTIGMALVVYRHHYPAASLPSNGIWVWLAAALTFIVLGYAIYSDHYPKVVEKIVEKPIDRVVEKTVPQECPQPRQKVESKKPQKSISQGNQGGSDNTNTQIGTTQAPVAVAPYGIANAAPNLGTQSVYNAPPARHLTDEQKSAIASSIQGKPCKIVMMGALSNIEDAQAYALELRNAFKSAGCDVPDGVLL